MYYYFLKCTRCKASFQFFVEFLYLQSVSLYFSIFFFNFSFFLILTGRAGDRVVATSPTIGDALWEKNTVDGIMSAVGTRLVFSNTVTLRIERALEPQQLAAARCEKKKKKKREKREDLFLFLVYFCVRFCFRFILCSFYLPFIFILFSFYFFIFCSLYFHSPVYLHFIFPANGKSHQVPGTGMIYCFFSIQYSV